MSKNENGTNVKRELELSEEFAEAAGGYWRGNSKDKPIYDSQNHTLIGHMKTLKFHAYDHNNKGHKQAKPTEWIMHEYRLSSNAVSYSTTYKLTCIYIII